jgi:excinuclease ABC subunit A
MAFLFQHLRNNADYARLPVAEILSRLASQLGSNLRGVCYILDEPTIGLHARDNDGLLDTLHALRAKGNTVTVVEHDEETIRRAEHVVDLGPGGGVNGGYVVAQGTLVAIVRSRTSLTGRLLKAPRKHAMDSRLAASDSERKTATALMSARGVQEKPHGAKCATFLWLRPESRAE